MKNNIYIILAAFTLIFSGCEKMVDLDLNTIEPRLVIDAYITDQEYEGKPPCCVTLSLTQDYYDKINERTYVSDAEVYLRDESTLTETRLPYSMAYNGYISTKPGEAGKTYTVRVVADGVEYKSTATIPETILISKLDIYSFELDGKYWFTPRVSFDDPAGIDNYYYYVLWINGKKMSSIDFDDDEFFDGLHKERLLFFDKEENNDDDLIYGDRVEVELHSIDVGAFNFYKSLYSVASGGGTNPIGNFSGGVLGCFKAYGRSNDIIPSISEDDVFSREL